MIASMDFAGRNSRGQTVLDRRPHTSAETTGARVTSTGRILPSLRRISTTPLSHSTGGRQQDRYSTSSTETLASAANAPPLPTKVPSSASRPTPLRSAAAAAAAKTRRLVSSKSDKIQPGIDSVCIFVIVVCVVSR